MVFFDKYNDGNYKKIVERSELQWGCRIVTIGEYKGYNVVVLSIRDGKYSMEVPELSAGGPDPKVMEQGFEIIKNNPEFKFVDGFTMYVNSSVKDNLVKNIREIKYPLKGIPFPEDTSIFDIDYNRNC